MKKIIFLFLGLSMFIFNSCENDIVNEPDNELQLDVPISTKAVDYDDTKLHYYGNNKWYGNFGSVTCWFSGASPTQLQNGVRSTWNMIVSPVDPLDYDKKGVNSWGGSASGFYININCVSSGGTIKMLNAKKIINTTSDGNGGWIVDNYYRLTTKYISVLGPPGNCLYEGKIILDSNCKPLIVSKDSDMPTGCLEDDDDLILILD
ncbi:hypothetical protein FF125_13265 [Aureibaculum algae]|uniref:Uncharacterized protein n=1 Tax=Aureibaculum algae TaxID=2584122 RepID=A0A5B7TVM6_9FLAO|nr:hypothetical protein [Aureibaculum algae]QCX39361.1 hypothetical protein FF125_13265 [Aureibaculum algae]